MFDKKHFRLFKGENKESIYFNEELNDEKLTNSENGPDEMPLWHLPANQNRRD